LKMVNPAVRIQKAAAVGMVFCCRVDCPPYPFI